ncbi:MAG: BtpA/SgcQ family protein, partial [Byssovorax sp.]
MTPPWKARLDALQIRDLGDIFGTKKPIIGMVHCWPMPGAPGYTGYGLDVIIEHAIRDAEALRDGGVDGLIVENMWDIPFRAGARVAPESIAAHAVVARAVGQAVALPLGINLVHNGGVALLGIALAAGARFIRVCMFTGAGVWEAGEWDEGCSA